MGEIEKKQFRLSSDGGPYEVKNLYPFASDLHILAPERGIHARSKYNR